MKRFITGLLSVSALAVSTLAVAQTKEVTIGYQDMVVPYRVAQEAKELEKATGYKINWKQFGGGGEVIKAMASGAVQIGESVQPALRQRCRAESRSRFSGSSTISAVPRRWSSRKIPASRRSPI